WRTLAIVQKEAPEIATSYLTEQLQPNDTIGAGSATASPWTNGVRYRDHGSVPKMIKAAGGAVWAPDFRDPTPPRAQAAERPGLTAALAKEAKSLGLKVLPWTVNERADTERLIDWGADGLITDYPDRLREVMAAKGLALPQPTPVAP